MINLDPEVEEKAGILKKPVDSKTEPEFLDFPFLLSHDSICHNEEGSSR